MQSSEVGPEIEREWRRVEQLLGYKTEAGAALALVEAQKVFAQVLEAVSYGPSLSDRVSNADGLFRNMSEVLFAQELYEKIVAEPGFKASMKDATKACDALESAIIDLVGRDYEPRGSWARFVNGLNFFWGHHPRVLVGLLFGILAFVAVVWFLADTAPGQWAANTGVGFARFVLARPWLMIVLVSALIAGWWGSRPFWHREEGE